MSINGAASRLRRFAAAALLMLLTLLTLPSAHAITLAAVVIGGLSAPAHIVEPAIAATIVGMALFDRWSLARQRPLAHGWRLGGAWGWSLAAP